MVQKQKHKGKLIIKKNNYDIINCQSCGFIHCLPIPQKSELHDLYSQNYYSTEKPEYIKKMQSDLDWLNMVYEDKYKKFEKIIGKYKKTILDIGSGPGYFLKKGRDRGWDTLGIEPSLQAFNFSKKELGLNVLNIFLNNETKDKINRFSVIHLNEVLEHVPNPINLTKIIYEKLYRGGIVSITVPNDFNPIQKILNTSLKYESWWVAPPHHINYFNNNSLSKLLKNAGFKILDIMPTFPIDIFLLMGENYVKHHDLGRKYHSLRKKFELNLSAPENKDFKIKLYKKLLELDLGREISIIAKKM